jgi:hypothetical protein
VGRAGTESGPADVPDADADARTDHTVADGIPNGRANHTAYGPTDAYSDTYSYLYACPGDGDPCRHRYRGLTDGNPHGYR